jgi:hypothetical protein
MNTTMEKRWWGSYRIDEGATGCWRLGGLRLWIHHGRREWQVLGRWEAQTSAPMVQIPCPEPLPDTGIQHRYGFGAPGKTLRLEVRLPDRPLVWRPAEPFSIAPGEEVVLYLRTPLWVALQFEGAQSVLWEAPVRRLSDTWFGAPTDDGGYAYSADREVLFEVTEAAQDTLHAITPIALRNSANAVLHLERLNLPVPFLSLFASQAGWVWTQRITLERDEEDEELALLRIGKGAPREAGDAEFLNGPRLEGEKHLVFQAFSRLFR